jgi:opacity protein-like surface antigen
MRFLLPALGLIGLLSPAFAADYALPTLRGTETFVPAYPTYFGWDGFYAGGHLAYGNANADFTNSTQPLLALALRNLTFEQEFRPSGIQVLGVSDVRGAGLGGFVGYNVQYDNAILGFEFNYTHMDFTAGAPDYPIGRLTGALSNGKQYNFLLTGNGTVHTTDAGVFRLRAGYVAGSFMPYLTLGLAAGRADLALSVSCACQEVTPNPNNPNAPLGVIDFSFTQGQSKDSAYLFGWAGGGGLDFALTQYIFARAEYEYIQWSPVWRITSHLQFGRVGLGVRF